jgi:hypothetical protein
VPLLVTLIAPVKPVLHSLVTTYWQLAAAVAEIADKPKIIPSNAVLRLAQIAKRERCSFITKERLNI